MKRWIMHIDMDAFFASVEELDAPELRGLPVIVGGGVGDGKDTVDTMASERSRGVVCAASYAARKFGVHSAMPLWQARQKCPQGIFVPTRKWRYAEVSREVMAVFHDFSPVVEQASVDEAYVDATGLERIFGPVEYMAMELKRAVKARTGLTCSVGLAPVKFVAKIASDMRKPDGLFIVQEEELADFLATLPVGRIPGVGKKMLAALELLGVRQVGDVLRQSQGFWEQRFGKGGVALYERAQGIDTREVEPFTPPKSESAENTFSENTKDMDVLRRWLLLQSERVASSLRGHGLAGRTITIKVKFADFRQITRSHSLPKRTNATQAIFDEAVRLLMAVELKNAVRLIGVGVSGFEEREHKKDVQATQLLLPLGPPAELVPEKPFAGKGPDILEDTTKITSPKPSPQKQAKLDAALDALRQRYGTRAVQRGDLLGFDE